MAFPSRTTYSILILLLMAGLLPALWPASAEAGTVSLHSLPPLLSTQEQAVSCSGLQQEAEAAYYQGAFVIGTNSEASGGQYVTAPNGSGFRDDIVDSVDFVDFCFNVTTAGTYRIRARIHTPSHSDNSFFVTVDGQPAAGYLWQTPVAGSYQTEYVSDQSSGDPVQVTLSSGQHHVRFYLREDGARLDLVALEAVEQTLACGPLAQEAEAGERVGAMTTVSDSAASGGQYIHAPNGSSNYWDVASSASYAKYCFDVTSDGTYLIKTRAHAPSGRDDSFFVTVDGAPAGGYLWDVPTTGSFETAYVTDRSLGEPVSVALPAGQHVVRVYVREDGARLDTVALELQSGSPGSTCGGLVLEAERGALAGRFAVANDNAASGGSYVHVPQGSGDAWSLSGDYVEYCFGVPTSALYSLQARVYAASGGDNSFFVTVDGQPLSGYLWEWSQFGAYRDEYVSDRNAGPAVNVNLTAGQHKVRVYLREDGARLDTLSLEAAGNLAAPDSIYWGAYVRNAPWQMSDLDAFEAAAGKRVSILHFGYAWEQNSAMKPFPTAQVQAIRQRGSIPMVNWLSWHLGYGVSQPAYKLTEITGGAYDAFIRGWAEQAKAWGHPFFLRFDHEMDGTWTYPYSVNLNGNRVEDFVPMWRHVHNIFESVGANNVTWVWCPNKRSGHTTPYAPLYPGDAYVDWTCIDGYNWNNPWLSFGQVLRGYSGEPLDSYGEMLSVAPNKPLMIGEFASDEAGDGGAAKAAWIRETLQQEIPNRMPAVKAIVWFNWSERSGYDWVITSSSAAQTAFQESIGLPVYTSNDFANLSTSPIPPRR